MKTLKHKFKSTDGAIITTGYLNLFAYDWCTICNKYVYELNETLDIKDNNIQKQFDFLDKNHPCLTEDELIIKNIIE